MNREKLLGALPNGADFTHAPNYGKKDIVEVFIRSVLDAIADDGREPDDLEAHDIAATIGLLAAGMYYAALACAKRALAPVEMRSTIKIISEQDPPPAKELRLALDAVSQIHVRNC